MDEVEELHSPARVALGERDDESQVGLEEVVLRLLAVLSEEVQFATLLGGHRLGFVLELVLGVESGLNATGEVDLLLGVQQRYLADLLEVVLDRVSCRTGNGDLLDGFVRLIGIGDDEAALDLDPGGGALAQSRSVLRLVGLFFGLLLAGVVLFDRF